MGSGSSKKAKPAPAKPAPKTAQPSNTEAKPAAKETVQSSDAEVKPSTESVQPSIAKETPKQEVAEAGDTEEEPVMIEGQPESEARLRRTMSDSELYNSDRWQDVNLADLMKGLELRDDAYVWEEYVDKLVSKEQAKIKQEKERKGWKTVRLFVSSTFKDMGSERDYLVKKVFPQLRIWCEERKLRLIECDLRWGVPKDADTRETLTACLSEIDRCREENAHPYFLTLMSERYGWVPKVEDIPMDIRTKYKWIPGLSVTASEIMVGGYWDRNSHTVVMSLVTATLKLLQWVAPQILPARSKIALYLFRTPDYLDQMKDEHIKEGFVEKEETKRDSLVHLKDKIRNHYPDQVYNYSCHVEHEGDGKVVLGGLEEMGKRVLKHFIQCLEYQYPTDSLGIEPSLSEVLAQEHETFMIQRSAVLLGRDDCVEKMHAYIRNTTDSPLVLVGFPGSGKSALMAYAVKQYVNNKKHKVFYHFIGATPRSTDLFQILTRVFLEFMPKGTKMPEDVLEMKRFSHTMFKHAAEKTLQEGYTSLVIFLDALNQMDDDGDAQYLAWLPRPLPKGIRIVVSTLEGKSLNVLRGNKDVPKQDARACEELSVDALGIEVRKKIVQKILAEYNKKLDEEQMKTLINKHDAGRPLWLAIACEELRVFGEFRKLGQKIKDIPEEITALLEMVLRRIVEEYGKELVTATLCLVEMSRFGLLETELLDLLAIQPTLPGSSVQDGLCVEGKLPMAKWALVYVGLRQFLRPCGSAGEGRLDFHHRTISKAVRNMYLTEKSTKIWWHKRLTDYFITCKDMERKAEELPYHLECSEDKERLQTTLLSQDMFDVLYQETNKQQLMKYWRFIGGYSIAADAYVKSLKEYLAAKNITDVDKVAPIQTKVAWFVCDIGEYDTAMKLVKEVIAMITEKHGSGQSVLLADPLHCIVYIVYRKALQYVYGSHPGYKECCQLGRTYSTQCAFITEKFLSKDQRLLANILTLTGYFNGKEYLERSMRIFEKIGDQQGLAWVLYMLGEKNQYNDDMQVPIGLFTRSLALCMSVFGKVHLHTARCLQLFGQLYWNSWIYHKERTDFIESCLDLYKQELEILCEIQGDHHPITVRSREDVVIILQSLKRDKEADEIQALQPKQHVAL